MTRARELANFADNTSGLESLTVSDITDLSVSASNINSATNQIIDSSTDLNVDSNTLVVDKSANAVGINEPAPGSKFEVRSDVAGDANLVTFKNLSTNSGLHNADFYMNFATTGGTEKVGVLLRASKSADWSSSANEDTEFSIYTRKDGTATKQLTIDKNGNVGVNGTYDGFTPTFSVEGTNPAIGAYKDATNFVNTVVGSAVVTTLFDDSADYKIASSANRGGTGESVKFTIKSSGKVGIGTTSPVANLHIQTETDETDEGTDVALTLGSNTTGKMRMYFGVNDANNYTYIGSVESGTAYRNLILQPNGGSVGIGVTEPAGDLHISESGASEVRFQMTNSNTGHAGSDGFAIVLNAAANEQYFWNYETRNMIFGNNNSTKMTIDSVGHTYPGADATQDLGASSYRWRNIYTGDLHLSNEGSVNDIDGTSGDWTIQEGSEDLFIINNKSGKQYKIKMEEV